MGKNIKANYGVDLVFCIDATNSMDHIIDTVKDNALNFYQDFMGVMEAKHKRVSGLRIRVVAFRDYIADRENAMLITDFFSLPQQAEDFQACIRSIVPDGGGDDPEDGLEALGYAMKSDWIKSAEKRRHVIVVWTDDDAHNLGFGKQVANYPKGMAKDFNELTEWWGCKSSHGIMDEDAKRLIMFAPGRTDNTEYTNWARISDNWNKVIQYESDAGIGLSKVEYSQILNAISQSI